MTVVKRRVSSTLTSIAPLLLSCLCVHSAAYAQDYPVRLELSNGKTIPGEIRPFRDAIPFSTDLRRQDVAGTPWQTFSMIST